MLRQPRRLLSAVLAIVLGIAFVTTALAIGSSMRHGIELHAAGTVQNAAVVAAVKNKPGAPLVSEAAVAAMTKVPGVTDVRPVVETAVRQIAGERTGVLFVRSLPRPGADVTVVSGRMPNQPGEAVVNEAVVRGRRTGPGQALMVASEKEEPMTVQVVGVVRVGPTISPTNEDPVLLGFDQDLFRFREAAGYDTAYVSGKDDQEQLRESINGLPQVQGLTLRTGQDEIEHRIQQMSHGSTALTGILLGFAVVALFVSALVISNTFAILTAQRVRELALLRCVGATRRQIFRSVLGEAAVIGAFGSAFGLLLGLGCAAIAVHAVGKSEPLITFAVTWSGAAIPLVVGMVLSVIAALGPARQATAVSPLAALRPQLAPVLRTRAGVWQSVAGALGLIGGTALVVGAATLYSVPMGLAGGVLSFAAILLLAPVLVPAAAVPAGSVARAIGGLPGELAVRNAQRNPRRAAATAGALLIGVTLISMMLIGAQTGQTSVERAVNGHYPADAQVGGARPVTSDALERIRATPDVDSAALVSSGQYRITANGRTISGVVLGVDPSVAPVLREPRMLDGLGDNVIVMSAKNPLAKAGTVEVSGPAGTARLNVVVTREASSTPLISAAVAHRLDPEVTVNAWVRFSDRAEPRQAMERLADTMAPAGFEVGGAATERAELQKIIDGVLLAVIGMLAVAIVIALIGVGNTLGLSVLERTQENGLLRALGLTRLQLRGMLGIEALTLAAIATIVGLALGTGYGVAAAYALIGKDMTVVVAIPWARLAAVAALALAAGWLASVLPGVRASRVPPAAALASSD